MKCFLSPKKGQCDQECAAYDNEEGCLIVKALKLYVTDLSRTRGRFPKSSPPPEVK